MSNAQIHVEKITGLLSSLYDCEAYSNEIESPTEAEGNQVVATYKEADSDELFAISCDLTVACSLGAALTRIPPGTAESAANDCDVPDNIADNLHEVLNICSSIFADLEGQRVVLNEVFLPNQDLAPELGEKLKAANTLLQVKYELDRYPEGKISLLQFS